MTTDDRIVEELEVLLRRVNRIVKKRGREILANYDITPPQFDALQVLINNGEITMGELCDRLYLACSTATDLIDRMERNGYIERQRDQNDRRVIRLKVTEAGHDIISEVMKTRKEYLATILEHLEEKDKEQMVHALSQLYSLMTKDVG
ncbi:MAG: MarR family transcriptional regulator [Bacillota bacterium]